MNIFLRTYNEFWLLEENTDQEAMIEDLTESFEDHEQNVGTEEVEETKPDPLTQLMTTFSRKATTEHGASMKEDPLYMRFAFIFSQSCGGAEEEEEGDEEGGEEGGASIHVSFSRSRRVNENVAPLFH